MSKKKQSNQPDASTPQPGTSSEVDETEEEGKVELQGEGGDTYPVKVMVHKRNLPLALPTELPTPFNHQQNGIPPATNSQDGKNVNGDNSDDDSGDGVAVLRGELEKEKARSQVLERQLASLRKDLIEKSKSVEVTASVGQDKLLKEKARSQELEKAVQGLKSKLTQKSASAINDKVVQEKLQKLEEQFSELRKVLDKERGDRENERVEADQQLAKVQEEKQQLDTQYKTLLGRVVHIKTTLGDKLKSDAVSNPTFNMRPLVIGNQRLILRASQEELERTRNMVKKLEEESQSLSQTIMGLQAELDKTNEEGDRASQELSTLRNRMNLSHKNWAKERNDLLNAEKIVRTEYEAARQAMQEWEVIATEERAVRESTGDRVIELEEQLANQQAVYDRVLSERDSESNTVNGLRRALQDIQYGIET